MSWTKRQFVNQAFETIGLASYEFDLSADELQSACRQLDAMMGNWNAKGIRIGYPMPSSPEDTDLDMETTVPDAANEAIYLNLALRIATGFGKVVMPEVKQFAFAAYQTLLRISANPPYELQFPNTLPRGAGNKPWRDNRDNFIDRPTDHLLAGEDDTLDFN
jgi:hypothetical protein